MSGQSKKGFHPFPYEAQRNTGLHRRCAAAALVMVYRSFGLEYCQEQVYDEMDRSGRTQRIARHAMDRGFETAILRFSDPWAALCRFVRDFAGNSFYEGRLILNHRLAESSALGHFSVLTAVDLAENRVFLHDPQFGPNRCLKKDTLLRLWRPLGRDCEICGRIAIAIYRKTSQETFRDRITEDRENTKSDKTLPDLIIERGFCTSCPRCAKPIVLECFASLLELCDHVFCPGCDFPQRLGEKSR